MNHQSPPDFIFKRKLFKKLEGIFKARETIPWFY